MPNKLTSKSMITELDVNSVLIIESLLDKDTKTGNSLYSDIVSRLCEYQKIHSQFFKVNSKQEFINCFKEIRRVCASKKFFPMLHLEVHGSTDGLHLSNGDIILWKEMRFLCRELNIELENQLILSLASCYGAYIALGMEIDVVCPFWGLIAPKEEVTTEDIVEDFTSFFQEFLKSFNIESALNTFNVNNSRHKYIYMPAQGFFDKYIIQVVESSKIYKKEKFKELSSRTKDKYPNLNRRDRRKELKKNIKTFDRNAFVRRLRNRFLMGRVAKLNFK